jgi:UDP-N-acetylmuramoyl-L-alanyl-D-glutamate--2,6-diaminopimelate ligase
MTMKLSELVRGIVDLPAAGGDPEVSGLTADSRKVAPGHVFVALSGAKTDGARFVAPALAAGAVAVVTGAGVVVDGGGRPVLTAAEPRRALSLMAARFAGAQPRTVVAVTGTAGKTSIVTFTREMFAKAGFAAASIGTVGIVSPKAASYAGLTTPDPVQLHKDLAALAAEGVTHAAMEASSHGLDQFRLDGVKLTAGAFTNLSRDHLDYHADEEAYFAAKMRLFDELLPDGAPAIVDLDEPWGIRAAAHAMKRGLTVFSIGRSGDELRLLDVTADAAGQVLDIDGVAGRRRVLLPLTGTFQASNALVAAGLAIAGGVAPETAVDAMEGLTGAAGRLDLVGRTPDGAPVFVDYAHKPGALETVLTAVRPATTGRLIVVFGCGGDRDPGKRPMMGEIATRLADVAIVTDDNPRSEDPARIRAAILAAAPGAVEIGDRGEAIRRAVAMLKAGDLLVIAGKGHETGQIVGQTVLPFSDHDVARAALEGLTA